MNAMYRPTLYSSLSPCASGVCAALNAWIFSPDRGFNAKFLLYQAIALRDRSKVQERGNPYKVIHMDGVFRVAVHRREAKIPSHRGKVGDVLLFQVIPYYLEGFDGVRVLLTVSHGENGKHRGFI